MSDLTRKRISKVIVAMLFFVMNSYGQNEYLYDIGIGGGLSGYTGDVSSNFIKPLSYNYNGFYRSNLNPRFSFCVDFDYGSVSGSSTDLGVSFPITSAAGIGEKSFSTNYQGVDLILEINFFPYPYKKSVLNSYNISPFYFVGLGSKNYTSTVSATVDGEDVLDSGSDRKSVISIPFGVGLKWKISDKWGFQFKFKTEKLFTDSFDGDHLDNPYQLDGFKYHRQDWLYLTSFSLFYSFGKEVWDCHCDKESKRKYDEQKL